MAQLLTRPKRTTIQRPSDCALFTSTISTFQRRTYHWRLYPQLHEITTSTQRCLVTWQEDLVIFYSIFEERIESLPFRSATTTLFDDAHEYLRYPLFVAFWKYPLSCLGTINILCNMEVDGMLLSSCFLRVLKYASSFFEFTIDTHWHC